MSRRIRVVGNSHVAALMRGWDRLAPGFPDLELSFFASGSTLFRTLKLDARLRFGIHDPSSYRAIHVDKLTRRFGATTVDLSDCDAVFMVGQGFGRRQFVKSFSRFSIDRLHEKHGRPRLSEAAFLAFAGALANANLPGHEWRNWTPPRLFVIPSPVPRESCNGADPAYAPWAQFAREPADTGLSRIEFLRLYDRMLAGHLRGAGIVHVERPPEVVAESGLTPDHFGFNRSRLGGDLVGEADDYHHMNAEYGTLVLKHALDRFLAETRAAGQPGVPAENAAA